MNSLHGQRSLDQTAATGAPSSFVDRLDSVCDQGSYTRQAKESSFEVVQEKGDSLLIVARTSPTVDTATAPPSTTTMTEAQLKEIVARSSLNQGIIALRGGDREGAEKKIMQAEELLEAKYSLVPHR